MNEEKASVLGLEAASSGIEREFGTAGGANRRIREEEVPVESQTRLGDAETFTEDNDP